MIRKHNPSHDERTAGLSAVSHIPVLRRGLDPRSQIAGYAGAAVEWLRDYRVDVRRLVDSIVLLLGVALIVGYAALLVWVGMHMPVSAAQSVEQGVPDRLLPAWDFPGLHSDHAMHRGVGRAGGRP